MTPFFAPDRHEWGPPPIYLAGVGSRMTEVAGERANAFFHAFTTAAYRGVLDHHGWGDLQAELTRMSEAGRWSEVGEVIDDEILHAFSVVGDPPAVAAGLERGWGPLGARISLSTPFAVVPGLADELLAELQK